MAGKTSFKIDLDRIAQIESSGKDDAVGDNGLALGRFQIHSPVVKEYNAYTGSKLKHKDMLNGETASIVADWYLNKRIPQMLNYFKIPDTLENRIISYNAGIGTLTNEKKIPKTTSDYIKKYLDFDQSQDDVVNSVREMLGAAPKLT